jgi:hypothetical protein
MRAMWIISPIVAIGLLASGGESRGQTPTVSVETEYQGRWANWRRAGSLR